MTPGSDRLLRHLALAVVVKLIVLAGLWWAFVRDARVSVDAERLSAHMSAPVGPSPSNPGSAP